MMKNYIKTVGWTALISLSVFALQGCGSGLEPDTFSVELNEMGGIAYHPPAIITIRSNSPNQIDVTNVTVNNGQCQYIGHDRRFNFPLHFQMGQVSRLRLQGCSFENVVQVDIETTQGTASYSFN